MQFLLDLIQSNSLQEFFVLILISRLRNLARSSRESGRASFPPMGPIASREDNASLRSEVAGHLFRCAIHRLMIRPQGTSFVECRSPTRCSSSKSRRYSAGDSPHSEQIKLIAKREQPESERMVRLDSKELPDAVPVAGVMAQDLTICEAVWCPQ